MGSGVGLIEGVEKEEEDFSVVVAASASAAVDLDIERGRMGRWGV